MNASMILPAFEERVRERAYHLWESEGRPAGRHAEHWRVSELATLAELEAASAIKPAKAKPAPKKAAVRGRAAARPAAASMN